MNIVVTVQVGGGQVASVTLPLTAELRRQGMTADLGPLGRLTPAELRVLRLAAAGLEYKHVAAILYLSERTVRTHMQVIIGKLDVPNARMAAALALVSGIFTADDLLAVWREHRADMLAEGK